MTPTMNKVDMLNCAAGHHDFGEEGEGTACRVCGHEESELATPPPAKVWMVEAEHFSNPGRPLTAHATEHSANLEAADLVNIMLKDTGWQPLATGVFWRHHLDRLHAEHGEDSYYVEILELEVKP